MTNEELSPNDESLARVLYRPLASADVAREFIWLEANAVATAHSTARLVIPSAFVIRASAFRSLLQLARRRRLRFQDGPLGFFVERTDRLRFANFDRRLFLLRFYRDRFQNWRGSRRRRDRLRPGRRCYRLGARTGNDRFSRDRTCDGLGAGGVCGRGARPIFAIVDLLLVRDFVLRFCGRFARRLY